MVGPGHRRRAPRWPAASCRPGRRGRSRCPKCSPRWPDDDAATHDLVDATLHGASCRVLLVGLLGCWLSSCCCSSVLAVVGKVPLSYNVRNLVVRWRITLLTGPGLHARRRPADGHAGLRQRHVPADRRQRPAGQRHRPVRRRHRRAVQQPRLRRHQRRRAAADGVLRDDDGKPLASWEVYVVVNQPIPERQAGRPAAPLRAGARRRRPGRSPAAVHDLGSAPGRRVVLRRPACRPRAGRPRTSRRSRPSSARASPASWATTRASRRLEVGDIFELGPRKWVVVGIMKSAGSTFDSEVWAKRQLVGQMFGKDELHARSCCAPPTPTTARRLADGPDRRTSRSRPCRPRPRRSTTRS